MLSPAPHEIFPSLQYKSHVNYTKKLELSSLGGDTHNLQYNRLPDPQDFYLPSGMQSHKTAQHKPEDECLLPSYPFATSSMMDFHETIKPEPELRSSSQAQKVSEISRHEKPPLSLQESDALAGLEILMSTRENSPENMDVTPYVVQSVESEFENFEAKLIGYNKFPLRSVSDSGYGSIMDTSDLDSVNGVSVKGVKRDSNLDPWLPNVDRIDRPYTDMRGGIKSKKENTAKDFEQQQSVQEELTKKVQVTRDNHSRKRRKDYPSSWGLPNSQNKLKKRVLYIFDGSRRLWKDELMLHTGGEHPMKKMDTQISYPTELEIRPSSGGVAAQFIVEQDGNCPIADESTLKDLEQSIRTRTETDSPKYAAFDALLQFAATSTQLDVPAFGNKPIEPYVIHYMYLISANCKPYRSDIILERVTSNETHSDSQTDDSWDETDWEEDTATDMNIAALSNLSAKKQNIIKRLMGEFWVIFNQSWGHNTRQHGSGSQSSHPASSSNSQGSGNLPRSSSKKTNGKRPRHTSDDQDPGEDEDDQHPKRVANSFTIECNADPRRFACPYRRHDPIKYCVRNWRSCALTGLETVARVK